MSYDPSIQFRCAIIRGKSKSDIDDLLMLYARFIQELCPMEDEKFCNAFDAKLSKILTGAEVKTIQNHRTEVVNKLFGMYFVEDNIAYMSEHTERLLATNDQPAFFKDVCFKLQFPNGMEAVRSTVLKMSNRIKLRPCVFIVQLINEAQKLRLPITKNDIGYYAINSLQVLQGSVSPAEVAAVILKNRNAGIQRVSSFDGKEGSYANQHVTELINYLELANLIQSNGGSYSLNSGERVAIQKFLDEDCDDLIFDVYGYSPTARGEIHQMRFDYSIFFSKLAFRDQAIFSTPEASLSSIVQADLAGINPEGANDIGDLGERMVVEYEKRRIEKFNTRYVGRVVPVGRQRGLGYDVSSVRGEGDNPGYAIYIEVKSTKRATKPSRGLVDSFELTRNEWIHAEQHADDYFIYRIYITNEGVFLAKLSDPVGKAARNEIFGEPIKYRIDFNESSTTISKIN